MRRRCVCAEKQTGNQTATATTAIVTREVPAARIKTAKGVEIPIAGNIAVATENATGALPEIGNDNGIRLMSGAALVPAEPNEPNATRLPSIKTKVSLGNRPRRLN